MAYRVREIDLGDNNVVLARVESLEAEDMAASPAGYGHGEDVGAFDVLADRVTNLQEMIGSVGRSVRDAARQAGPDEVSVSFGAELAVKSGKTVAFIADGQAKASLSVTLTWKSQEQERTRSGDEPGGEGSAATHE